MEALLTRLDELSEKAEYLAQRSRSLVEENRGLKDRVRELESGVEAKETEANLAKEQYEILKLAKNVNTGMGDGKTEELKKKINEYIREIDQCLKLIGD